MSAGDQHRSLSVDGAPESWFRPDSAILEQIDKWIESGHPGNCTERIGLLLSHGTHRYSVTTQKLVAHCIKEHGRGIELIYEMYRQGHFPLDEKEVGFADSIRETQVRLCEEVLAKQSISNEDAYVNTVRLVARHLDDERFRQVWNAVWTDGLARRANRLAEAIFRVAAFSALRSSMAIRLIETSIDEVWDVIPQELVFCLAFSPEIRTAQDKAFDALLSKQGANAARTILMCSQSAQPIPNRVPQATRLLVASNPIDSIVLVGLGLCLESDPEYAIPLVVEKVNGGKSTHYHGQFLEWRIQNSDQKRLFHAMASDAIKRDLLWHPILAQTHHDLITDIDAVIEWLKETLEDDQASRYNAALVVYYLSEPTSLTGTDKVRKLIEHARALHRKYGSRDEKTICQEMNLTDSSLSDYEELVAMALAKDVVYPSDSVDAQKMLATIKTLPFTYKALGEIQLDSDVKRGDLPPFAECFAVDADSEHGKLLRAREFRNAWEKRFSKILKAKAHVAVPTRRIRKDRHVWSEMRILSQLIDFFEVEYEPERVPGMGTKRPEFLLKCEDGCLVLEVAAISTKPEDVREGVKVSMGGTTKKTLQNKLREKFDECRGDLGMPVVIAVDTSWGRCSDFDFENSLYGPLQFAFLMDQESRRMVAEGGTREAEKAFFGSDNVKCISAVVRVASGEHSEERLRGRMYRPFEKPSYPIDARLWVRLRSALFGESPQDLLAEISRVPHISKEEVEVLVTYGVDDFSFFGAGLIEFPKGMPMNEERFHKLEDEAKRLALIQQTGQIKYLESARGADLTLFYEEGIYTVNQVVQRGSRPTKIEEKLWNRLREEAAALSAVVPRY